MLIHRQGKVFNKGKEVVLQEVIEYFAKILMNLNAVSTKNISTITTGQLYYHSPGSEAGELIAYPIIETICNTAEIQIVRQTKFDLLKKWYDDIEYIKNL